MRNWRDLAPGFAATHEAYSEIGISPATFQGHAAAIWEFTYVDGVRLHAEDLGFVAGNYGFALYFQTHADRWEQSQDTFEALKASFEPPDRGS